LGAPIFSVCCPRDVECFSACLEAASDSLADVSHFRTWHETDVGTQPVNVRS
jgi:hypothetical protein